MSDEMKDECVAAFELWAKVRGWRTDRFDNPSGFIEFKNAETMKLWQGWYAARNYYAGRDEMYF